MIYVSLAALLIYHHLFLRYYQVLLPARGARHIRVWLSLAIIGAAYMLLNAAGLHWLTLPAAMAVLIVGVRFSTGANWPQAFYCGGLCVLSVYCIRDIFIAVSALALGGRMSDSDLYYLSTLLSLPLAALLAVFLRRNILPDNKLRHFLANRDQLNPVIAYEIVAAANMTVINWGRSLAHDALWYVALAIGSCVLILGMLLHATYQSIRSSELLEYQWRHKMIEEQFNRQLRHYESYRKYTESFQAFRHDYKSMMASVKSLLRVQENERAIQLIDDVYDEMQQRVDVHKKYSDNTVLDAILQDLAELCAEKEIRFSFKVFAPRNTGLSTLDGIRIFSNITNNAVEACEKVPAAERFIDITGGNADQWASIQVLNAYDGNVRMENERFLTTKPERCGHGVGISIVWRIAERLGGFVQFEANPETKVFSTRVLIPQLSSGDGDGPPTKV